MTAPTLFLDGRPLQLGKRIGKGGEGEVYALSDRGDQALKYYTISNVGDRAAKVEAMVRAGLANGSKLVSYPSAIIKDSKGRFAGFLMRLVNGHQPIHHLYAPGDRKANFPDADYRFLVHTALNVARALADVHARNCVIGDINHSGILVSAAAMVALIDADSFQVSENGREYLCTVGVPEYTPPELQGRSLAGVRRTPNHDAFGLAVIIFQLLCMGRHPFVGTYAHGEMPMEKAIAEHRFAYSTRRAVGMRPPPGAVALKDLPQQVAAAFEVAFDPAAVRPSAPQWVALLEDLANHLKRCGANDRHYYPAAANECSWCKMERAVGIVLFLPSSGPSTTGPSSTGNFDLQSLWAAIEAVPLPPQHAPSPVLADFQLAASPEAAAANAQARGQRIWNVVLVLGAGGGIAVTPALTIVWLGLAGYNLYRLFGQAAAGRKISSRLQQENSRWASALADWEKRCGGAEVHAHRKALANARRELQALPADHRTRIASYESNRRGFQLKAYLENHRLSAAQIDGVGSKLKTALISNNIDSAFQVSFNNVRAVSGVGPAKASALVAWRSAVESQFIFDLRPNATDKREKEKIAREFGQREQRLRTMLSQGAHELSAATRTVLARWQTADQTLLRVYRDRVQAEVDDDLVNRLLGARLKQAGVGFWALVVIAALTVLAMIANLVGPPKREPAPLPTATVPPTVEEQFNPPAEFRVSPPHGARTVNVREAASNTATVIDHLRRGEKISVTGRRRASDGSWWLFFTRRAGSRGYIAESVLAKLAATTSRQPECTEKSWPSQLLCQNVALRQLDAKLNKTYKGALKSLSGVDRLQIVQQQREWNGARASCQAVADVAACLTGSYQRRISELAKVSAQPDETSSPRSIPTPDQIDAARSLSQASAPVPRQSLASLITTDDYPASALRAEQEGRALVRLHINMSGAADQCKVVSSSGSPDLDNATCRVLVRRARYVPARDRSGENIDGYVTQGITWRLPHE